MSLILGLLFSVSGVILLATGVATGVRRRRQSSTWVSAEGQVVGTHQGTGARGSLYFPVIRFVTAEGRPVEFRSSEGTSWGQNAAGRRVAVIYDPHNPQAAQVKPSAPAWLGAGCLLALGAGVGLLGLVLLLAGLVNLTRG